MQLKDCMTREVQVVRPETSVMAAARRMKDLDVGALPVCSGDRLVGMVTDRDIAVRGSAEGRVPAASSVAEVMTPKVLYCFEDQDVQDAADLMADNQIRRLPVMSRNKRLVGIVSLGDLAVDAREPELAGETLLHVCEPAAPAGQDSVSASESSASKPPLEGPPMPKKKSRTETDRLCAECGMEESEWKEKQGYTKKGETYCCEGCAEESECTCAEEEEESEEEAGACISVAGPRPSRSSQNNGKRRAGKNSGSSKKSSSTRKKKR